VGRIFNSDFGLFYQVPLNAGALYSTTQTIDTYVYRALMQVNDIGMSAAAGLYQSLVGLILVLAANGIVRRVNSDNALF
ncbi:sugar ABC transporter permease, partial [Paenibacillus sp. TAF58]